MTNQQRLESLIAAERTAKALKDRSDYLVAYAQTQKLLASLMQHQK